MRDCGPLDGLRVLEFAKARPGSFAGMILSDLGADVLRIERENAVDPPPSRVDARGRRSLPLDLKDPDARALCQNLAEKADVLIEGHRPGVMERLGLGPEVLLARNPRLVYGRLTGWGQFGPYAQRAGHDINYIALSGALHAIGTSEELTPPLNLVGDASGSICLIIGVLAAIVHARATGEGQVIDAAMSDSAAYLMSLFYGMKAAGTWHEERGSNLLDGGAPFYNAYRCADGAWIAVGAVEPKFYAILVDKIGAKESLPQPQGERASWSEMKKTLTEIFATKTREEWSSILEDTEVCFAPVLSLSEAPHHPHNVARNTFVEVEGIVQPAPAPRFSATPGRIQWPPAPLSRDALEALAAWD